MLRLKRDSLLLQGAVIDPRRDAELRQAFVDMGAPGGAPVLQEIGAVPGADLGAKPVLVHRAHGQHDVRMRLGPAVGADVPMHIQVGDHAARDELPLDKVARQFDSLALVEFARESELDFAGQLGVFPLLGRFDGVPQAFALPQLLGNAGGRHHLGMDDAALVGKIVMAVEPLVVKP